MENEFWHITLGNVITIAIFILGGSGPLVWLIRALRWVIKDRQAVQDRLERLETEIRLLRAGVPPKRLPGAAKSDVSE